MPENNFEHRLTEVEQRSKSNSHRLDEVESRQDNLEELVSTVKVLATRQEAVETDVKEIKADVKALTAMPGKRWETLVAAVLGALAGSFVVWIASGMPGVG